MKKILTIKEATNISREVKKQGKTIVLVGGCFDILHIGHIEFLERAKQLAKILVVLLESDESVKKKKGNNRPIHNQRQRAKILSKIKDIDFIIPLPYLTTDRDYYDLVKKIKPDIIAVTKGDQATGKKQEQAQMVNAKLVEVMKKKKAYSSSKIISFYL